MRTLIVLGCLTLCTNVFARDRKKAAAPTPANLAVVDDEPMSGNATHTTKTGLDTGAHRDIRIAAPTVRDVGSTGGTLVERGAGEDPAQGRTYKPVSGLTQELAERQMRKYQAAIDTCVADAKKRNATATGTLVLTLQVAERKVESAVVAKSTVNDPALGECLVSAASKWTFSLSEASFSHTVVLGAPLASR